MKKENPLISAVQSRSKSQNKKTISVPFSDVPRETNIGDTLCVTGIIESISGGMAIISVSQVENETQGEDDGQEETKTSQVLKVQTQESNVGGM